MQCTIDKRGRQADESKVERYADARRMTDRLENIMALAGRERIADRMHQCGRIIDVGRCADCGKVHSVRPDRMCGHRLCPVCAMRRSRVIAAQGLAALEWVRQNEPRPYSMHMVTLTQRNVRQGELAREMDKLLEAMKQLRYNKAVRRGVIGAARTIEVTCNPSQREGLIWHPHVHLIVMLHEHPALATQDWWVDTWYDLMDLHERQTKDELRECTNVQPLKDQGAVYEISKYVAKVAGIWEGLTDEQAVPLITELDGAISGRKLQVWMGQWRKARRALNQADVERMNSEDLDEEATACPDCGGALLHGLMNWAGMDYLPLRGERA